MPCVEIEYQDQFSRWRQCQTMHNEANAFRTAQSRARRTGKRYRITDENGSLRDVFEIACGASRKGRHCSFNTYY